MKTRIRGGYKFIMSDKGEVVLKKYPAIVSVRRLSSERYARILKLLVFFKDGKSVQDISIETGWKKDRVYHEMYALKNMGLLPPDFKNPGRSVQGDNIVDCLLKEANRNAAH